MADLARDRLRLDRLGPQRRRVDFLPLRFAHSSRNKKLSPPPSSAVLRPEDGCGGDRPRPLIAIEAAVVAGSKTATKEK
jgi:hypothetical protein